MEAEKTFRPESLKIVLTPLLDDSGPNVFGLHPHLTSMLWTLSCGTFDNEGL